jgi:hypothetical protein
MSSDLNEDLKAVLKEKLTKGLKEEIIKEIKKIIQNNSKYKKKQIKNLRRHRNNLMNSEKTSINTKMKLRGLYKKERYVK